MCMPRGENVRKPLGKMARLAQESILGHDAPVIFGNEAPLLGRMQTNFGRYPMSLS